MQKLKKHYMKRILKTVPRAPPDLIYFYRSEKLFINLFHKFKKTLI